MIFSVVYISHKVVCCHFVTVLVFYTQQKDEGEPYPNALFILINKAFCLC